LRKNVAPAEPWSPECNFHRTVNSAAPSRAAYFL
jgi:hypothetical protein